MIPRTAASRLTLVYLGAVTCLGVLVALRATPLTGVDESYHFRRALQVSNGDLLATRLGPNDWGGKLERHYDEFGAWLDVFRAEGRPIPIDAARREAARLQAQPEGRKVNSFPSTASYPPLPYAGSAIGLAVARAGHAPLLSGLAMGRIGGLLAYVGLLAMILAVLPFGRAPVLALLTTPAAIALAASFSADPLTNGVSVLFAAAVLRADVAARAEPVHKGLLLLLGASLGLLKLSCAMLALLVVLVPGRLFASRRNAWAFRGGLVALAFGTACAWNLHYPFIPSLYWRSGGDPAASIALIEHRPIGWLLTAFDNIGQLWRGWWSWSYGGYGGGPVPYVFHPPELLAGVAIALCAVMALVGKRKEVRPVAAAVLAGVAAAYVLEILLLFTIGFSPPGSAIIQGVQGRYFLLPLVLFVLAATAIIPRRGGIVSAVPVLAIYLVLSARTVFTLAHHYRRLWQ